ncbi:MAG TPA: deoxyguanosinetriphosphate triphosphohydrolase [Hydrogenophaga sp.]|uniref:deoxyguanosinetriphosphate triphosphohydrolase n=1 Tax=Hydrogenophaga sp. TaxID=1904254 RepID=UPI002B5C3EC1|nr:deoxyguanosinetriphosphate triphosphohydrolase [Hydrogenophaga sp.]HMN92606.1 deoxyguanosinetriphosphate triphosphohydrolase [Hydrogenophaga sp.]HMP10380.1 deoxyguanosinetriphosphate triphosphohydrolase [Hydrogenophaga sp.]
MPPMDAAPPGLAPWACHPSQSRGRRFAEPEAPTRTAFQRDRDRIIHSTAFRRLVYKTQVFLNHEGDLFRTRLTHSLEVAQLGRSIARSLRLNEDLVEAIALAHDLGHTPFGHAGQDALHACLQALAGAPADDPGAHTWGFEHNLQSLRVVDALEERYPAFDGLNLCFETREGILKHCSRANAERLEAREPGGVAARFLHGGSPSLEAQLCNLADAIAYNAHDIDDGVRSGLLSIEQLEEVPLFERYRRQALQAHPHLQGRRLLFESIRLMLSDQVYDVIDATRQQLQSSGVGSVDEVRQAGPLVGFSTNMRQASRVLKQFLFRSLYRHPQVVDTTDRARQVVSELFGFYMERPHELPPAHARQPLRARAVADYIAGMTDRFAIREHQRLSGRVLFP